MMTFTIPITTPITIRISITIAMPTPILTSFIRYSAKDGGRADAARPRTNIQVNSELVFLGEDLMKL